MNNSKYQNSQFLIFRFTIFYKRVIFYLKMIDISFVEYVTEFVIIIFYKILK